MRELFDLANNPLFVKYVRARLRRNALMPGIIVVAFLSLCILFINSYLHRNGDDTEPVVGSHMFYWFQGILLVLLGGSQVAAAIAQMKESGIIDFHRITPIPPKVQTIGIMLGAPIRELILYSVTLPFALFVAATGAFGVTNFVKLLLVQLGSALMYYSLAMITGLAGGRARGASGRFVGVLVLINIMATWLYAVGIYGPTLVTSTPVYLEINREVEEANAQKKWLAQQKLMGNQRFQNPPPPAEPRPVVTFYGAPLPLVLQSLMFQGCVLTFLFIAASRRIHSARMPLYYKPTALLFMLSIAVLTLGSLWEAPTVLLALGMAYFFATVAIVLTNTVTPPSGDVVKGIQRARKLSDSRVPAWSDLSSNKLIVAAFAGITAATLSVALIAAPQPVAAAMFQLNAFRPWPCVAVAVLAILTYGFASQYFALAFGKRAKAYFILFLFFAWMSPIILGFIIETEIKEGIYLAAMSPIAGIVVAGIDIPRVNEIGLMVCSIAPVAICSVFFLILLMSEETRLLREVADEHRPKKRKRRKRDHDDDYDYHHDE